MFIIEYISRVSAPHYIFDEMKRIVSRTFKSGTKKQKEMVIRDINDWAKSIGRDDYLDLQKELAQRFGTYITNEDKIKKILSKGEISSCEEYRIVKDFSSNLSELDPLDDKISELERVLYDYYSKNNLG